MQPLFNLPETHSHHSLDRQIKSSTLTGHDVVLQYDMSRSDK
jgi:hypothetical protein